MAKRKAKRVEVECATPAGWRWLKSIVARSEKVSGARMDGEGAEDGPSPTVPLAQA